MREIQSVLMILSTIIGFCFTYSFQSSFEVNNRKLVSMEYKDCPPGIPAVIVVHSFLDSLPWVEDQIYGLNRGLSIGGYIQGLNVCVWMDSMEMLMSTSSGDVESIGMKKANATWYRITQSFELDHIKAFATTDDEAFQYFGLKKLRMELKLDVPIIFAAVNHDLEKYNELYHFYDSIERPGHNITGTIDDLHLDKAFEVVADVFQLNGKNLRNKTILVVMEDYTNAGRIVAEQLKELLNETKMGLKFEKITVHCYDEYKDLLKAVNHPTRIEKYGLLYFGLFGLEEIGHKGAPTRCVPYDKIVEYTISHSHIPDLSPFPVTTKGFGLFLGVGVDGQNLGYHFGRNIAKVLDGFDPSFTPIDMAGPMYAVNLDRMRQLGMKPNTLQNTAVVHNFFPAPWWWAHWGKYVLIPVAVIASLIFTFVILLFLVLCICLCKTKGKVGQITAIFERKKNLLTAKASQIDRITKRVIRNLQTDDQEPSTEGREGEMALNQQNTVDDYGSTGTVNTDENDGLPFVVYSEE